MLYFTVAVIHRPDQTVEELMKPYDRPGGKLFMWSKEQLIKEAREGSFNPTKTNVNIAAYEQINIQDGKIILEHVPVGTAGAEIQWIYKLNDDYSLGKKYGQASTASETEFALDAANRTIVTPVGVTGRIAVFYEYALNPSIMTDEEVFEFCTQDWIVDQDGNVYRNVRQICTRWVLGKDFIEPSRHKGDDEGCYELPIKDLIVTKEPLCDMCVIMPNGEFYSCGDVEGCIHIEWNDSDSVWAEKFKEHFLDTIDQNCIMTIVVCIIE